MRGKARWQENSAAIRASVLSAKMRNPYDYTLRLRLDSVLAMEGGDFLLQRGDSLSVLMRWEANQALMSLARVRSGQRLNAVVALSRNGQWMLVEGKRE